MKPNVLAVIQARTGSERLPGKVLLPLGGEPVIAHVVRAVSAARRIDEVVVATTRDESDDQLAEIVSGLGVRVYRGAMNDVLGRFIGAIDSSSAETIIRFTADDPLLDPDVIDRIVDAYQKADVDYVSNMNERSWPRGLDTEVFSRRALLQADREGKLPEHREHVTIYMRTHPEKFSLGSVLAPAPETWPELRLCVDTVQDYRMLEKVFDALYTGKSPLKVADVIAWLKLHPEVTDINSEIQQKAVFGRQY